MKTFRRGFSNTGPSVHELIRAVFVLDSVRFKRMWDNPRNVLRMYSNHGSNITHTPRDLPLYLQGRRCAGRLVLAWFFLRCYIHTVDPWRRDTRPVYVHPTPPGLQL